MATKKNKKNLPTLFPSPKLNFNIPKTHHWQFRIASDDASDMYLSGALAASAYGLHSMQYGASSAAVLLVAGEAYPLVVRMCNKATTADLNVQWREGSGTFVDVPWNQLARYV